MQDLLNYIKDVNNYPKEGIVFKDLTPLLENPKAYKTAVSHMLKLIEKNFPEVTHIVSPEARGFWFGCPLAVQGGYGFVPVRKPGKLPRETKTVSYDLEYGSEVLCIHSDSIKKGDNVLIVDDVLATGGTLSAIEELITNQGATVCGSLVLLELSFLNGRSTAEFPVVSLIKI